MARSHHRKKHKQHVKQFKHSYETVTDSPKSRSKAVWVFGIAGALVGFAVGYFASIGSIIWSAAGLIAGAIAGYYIGQRIDKEK
jgi:membrane associated rhomboid family serine protease